MSALVIEGSAREVAPAFDYGVLPAADAAATKAATERIRRRVSGQIKSIIETGDDLLHVKELLPHGHFAAWLAAEFGMTDRTARRYMSAAEAFKGKTDMVSELPVATIYALASPAAEAPRVAVLERMSEGEKLTEAAVSDILWEARQAKRQEAVDAKLSPAAKKAKAKRDAKAEERRRVERDQWQRQEEQRIEAVKAAGAMIASTMGERAEELISLLSDALRFDDLVEAIRAGR